MIFFYTTSNLPASRVKHYLSLIKSNFFHCILLALLLVGIGDAPANAAIFRVNSLSDANTGSGNDGTLRYCITQANLTPASDTINFLAAGTGTITIGSTPLPQISQPLTINGYSAPGAAAGTFSARSITVRIVAPAGATSALHVRASNTIISGINFVTYENGFGFPTSAIYHSESGTNPVSNVWIWGCSFNTTLDGNSFEPNAGGVGIGIYGNSTGGGASNVSGWIIGTNGDGTNDNNEGNQFTSPDAALGSRANNGAIRLFNLDNFVIAGNYFGLKKNGTDALMTFNTTAGENSHISLTNVIGTRIGTDGNNVSDFAERNYLVGSRGPAINIFSNNTSGSLFGLAAYTMRAPGNNQIYGNFIGTNTTGTVVSADFAHRGGVRIEGSSGNFVGASSPALGRNIIVNGLSGSSYGVLVVGDRRDGTSITSQNNIIENNYIGVLNNGTGASGNTYGVRINANNNMLANNISAINNIVRENLIANNTEDGIINFAASNQVVRSYGNTITRNSIYDNGKLGINISTNLADLALSPNDGILVANTSTAQANRGMDYGIISNMTLSGNNLTVSGYIGNNPAGNTAFAGSTVEFFTADNTPANQDGERVTGDGLSVPHGEGSRYLGALTADANGLFSGTIALTAGVVSTGTAITNTATLTDGSTSEFGVNVTVNLIQGNVFNEQTTNSNNIVDGVGTNAGTTLYAVLYNNSTGAVESFATVATNGAFSLSAISGLNYTIYLTTTLPTIGQNATPTLTPPSGWVYTGENNCVNTPGCTGNDGTANGVLSLGTVSSSITQANFGIRQPLGYIYVHKKALSEESSIPFPFTVTGGTTTVPNFSLNDLATQNSVADLGASQNGTLWATGENSYNLFYRNTTTSQWQAANNSAGTALINNARRLDGGENGTVYWIASTDATFAGGQPFFYNGTTHTAVSAATNVTDIASPWNGTVYFLSGGNVFFKAVPTSASAAVQLTTSANFSRIDGDPTTGDVIAMRNDGIVFRITSTGTAANLGQPTGNAINRDVAVTSDGTIFGSTQDFVYQYNGSSTWLAGEATSRKYASRMTGGVGKLVWGTTNELNVSDISKNIYTRVESPSGILWLNDERIRVSSLGNSIMIPVAPGTYTVTELVPTGWDLTDLQVYDPTGNSSPNLVGNTATVNVIDGETVGLVFENTLVQPFTMTQSCTAEYNYDFGTGSVGTYGGALTGQTSYHYQSGGQSFSNNYMVIGNASLLFPGAANLNDHTANNGQGRMMAIDANNENDAFFRRRFRGVIPGASYEFSAWIANINVGAAIKPNVTFEVVNPANYNIIQSYNTGNITTAGWNKYGITFVAVDTTFDLVIRNAGFGGSGNDLALDDIRFALIPPTDPFTTVANSDCNQSFGSITVTSPLGASFEYSRDSVSWQSSPVFSGLTPGPYRILARYAGSNGCIVSKRDTVLLSLCGNVFLDNNALTDATVNGAPTNLNGALKAVLYNVTTGRVDSIVNVSSTGTYSFLGTAGRNYTVYLTSSNTVTTGQTAVPPTTLPLGYINTGENIGTASGNDGTVNGILPLGVRTLSVNQANFGIRCGTNAGADRTACQFGTATMAAAGVGIWTAATGNPGTASITNTSSPTTTITNFSQPGTYLFIWTNGCPDTAAIVVTAAPNAGTDGSTTVCDNSTQAINLINLITGEQTGGSWLRISGTGGVSNIPAGTNFMPTGATTSVFRYIVTGTGACAGRSDTSFATVNINICLEICNNGIDDDGDGLTDCADSTDCEPIFDSVSITIPTCSNPTGKITVFAQNQCGTPIEYSINGGLTYQASSTFNALPAGNYNLKVRYVGSSYASTYFDNPINIIDLNTPDSDGDGVGDYCDDDDDNDGIKDTDENDCLNAAIASYPATFRLLKPSDFSINYNGSPQEGITFLTKDFSDQYGYPANSGRVVVNIYNANVHPTADAFYTRGDLGVTRWEVTGTIKSIVTASQGLQYFPFQRREVRLYSNQAQIVNQAILTPGNWSTGQLGNTYYQVNNTNRQYTEDSLGLGAILFTAMVDYNDKAFGFYTNDNGLSRWSTYNVEIRPECDYDLDGIPNRLDKDSDNDGCVDAIEGAGNFNYGNINPNGTLTGSVAGSGIPTIAGSGQGVGTSQDSTLNACNTTNAVNDENSTFINTPVGGNVLTNDYDIEGNTQTFGSFLNPSSTGNISSGSTVSGVDANGNPVANAGTLTFDTNGNYTFTPATGFTGLANMPYSICDNGNPSACDTANLAITVSPLPTTANSVIANNDEYTTQQGSTVTGNVTLNDADPQDDNFTVTTFTYDSNGDGAPNATGTVGTPQVVGGVSSNGTPVTNAGTLTLNSNGTFTFVPSPSFVGEVDLTYTICDNGTPQACSQTTITITVVPNQNGPQNDPPIAGDDFAYTTVNTPTTGNFIGNDRDLNGDPLSVNGTTINTSGPATPIQTLTTAQGGTVVLNANGTYTYTPPTGYIGPDRVVYEICDVTTVEPQPLCAEATIHLLVGTGYKISGTVWNDGNGMTDGYVNGSNGGTNADNKVYAVLTDTDGNVIQSVPVNTDGTYEFVNVPGNSALQVLLDTISRNSGEIVTISSLPQGWVSTGENTGTQAGRDNNINGISAVIPPLTTDVENVEFGIQRPPVADAKIYNVANIAFTEGAPAGYPVPGDFERFFTITTFSQYLTGNGNGGLLTGNDAEDCPNTQECNLGNTFRLGSLLPSTILYYDFGGETGIRRLVPGDIITNYNAENLVIYAREGSGMSGDPVGFSYSLVDAAGFSSTPVSYTILTESALPVELLTFEATLFGGYVSLDWRTASELNNNYFGIERSNDGIYWKEIGKVHGHGTTSEPHDYHFIDSIPLSDISYYRLLQVDYDGNYEYSPVRSIENNSVTAKTERVVWYPNPTNNSIYLINTELFHQIEVTDIMGRKVLSIHKADEAGVNLGLLTPGTYLIHFIGERFWQTDKVIVQ